MKFRRRWVAVFSCLALFSGFLTVGSLASPTDSAAAVTGSQFQPGYIISDQNFFDSSSMSVSDVQSFMASRSCTPRDGVPCLKDFTVTTPTTPSAGAGHCAEYPGGVNESAALILWKVARACGINPKVLLVLLQKEQSLLTNPSAYGYARAMGWGCPDSGPGGSANCDANYFGYFNQVYRSAWQFRQYTLYPVDIPGGGTRQYRIGTVNIQYHPNVACGSSPVTIVNQATANLYLYTPYQPNAAALNNLYGTGDACSAYGNRNFWRLYADWFGVPTDPPGSPLGAITAIAGTSGGIAIQGWAVDRDAGSTPVDISFWVDGLWNYRFSANQSNPAAPYTYPGSGSNHGWTGTLPAQPAGNHTVCAYAINIGAGTDVLLGCRQATFNGDKSPQGAAVRFTPGFDGVVVDGWAVDPDALSSAVTVSVWVDSLKNYQFAANSSSAAYSAALAHFPAAGQNHGWSGRVPTGPGMHSVCIYVVNKNVGVDVLLSCTTVNIPVTEPSPKGVVSQVTGVAGGISVAGWTVDPDALTSPVRMSFWLDSKTNTQLLANQSAPAADVQYPGAGPNHGYSTVVPATAGQHTLCVYAFNQNVGGDVGLSCHSVLVPTSIEASPKGEVLTVAGVVGGISLTGWAIDPDALTSPVEVSLWLDGLTNTRYTANQPYAAGDVKFPGAGPNHGWSASVSATPGLHRICFYAVNINQGADVGLSCHVVVVPASIDLSPKGEVLSVAGVTGGIQLNGWAIDPDALSSSVIVSLWLDSLTNSSATANQPYAAGDSKVPGAGPNHGWTATVPASPGKHRICFYAVNINQGADVGLSCHDVVVPSGDPSPTGEVLTVTGVAGGISLTGWAIDPDALASPVEVSLWLDSLTNTRHVANQLYAAGDSKVAGAGPNHGWSASVSATPGLHRICFYAVNINQGSDVGLSCHDVTVP